MRHLIETLERTHAWRDPARLRERVEALDALELHMPEGLPPGEGDASPDTLALHARGRALRAGMEAVNEALYRSIRQEIRQGNGADVLRRWAHGATGPARRVQGDGYDYLDALVSGVLPFELPEAEVAELPAEMVFYQPTPARHVFDLLERLALGEGDVLVDLGAGLGVVPLLVAACTGARGVGIEYEAAYVDGARRCVEALGLTRAMFVQQDARVADLSEGTVFYLYTPFTGTILRSVLDALRRQAERRAIRVCSYGPCTPVIAREPWLEAGEPPVADRIAVFRSR
ncbi:hypothetical protein ASG87_01005 [Frateuria sp. Soil773]|nr:hypothetical protein ASG87_01005 [Frateuria sp. Soil773]